MEHNFVHTKKINYLRSRPTFIVLLLFAILLSHAAWNAYKKYDEARGNKDRVLREYQGLLERKSFLSDEVMRLSTPRGMEEEFRKRFGVAKEGEEVVVIVDSKENHPGNNDNSSETWWARLRDIFK